MYNVDVIIRNFDERIFETFKDITSMSFTQSRIIMSDKGDKLYMFDPSKIQSLEVRKGGQKNDEERTGI